MYWSSLSNHVSGHGDKFVIKIGQFAKFEKTSSKFVVGEQDKIYFKGCKSKSYKAAPDLFRWIKRWVGVWLAGLIENKAKQIP